MQYTAQDQSAATKAVSKTMSVVDVVVSIACAPCLFCAVACMCFMVGDEGTFLDGPFCKDCVPDMVQNRIKRLWKKYKGKD
jgi:hypothetical protein